MLDFVSDPLILAVFAMVALPLLAVAQFFGGEKQLSDRLLKKPEKKSDVERVTAQNERFDARVDVRKELPRSRFGKVGDNLDFWISRNQSFSQKILQSGIKQNVADVVLICSLGFLLFVFFTVGSLGFSLIMMIAAGIFLFGAAPYFYLHRLIQKRQKQFLADFPDAIDLVVRGIRSGLPVTEAIENISSEFTGPMGETFGSIQAKVAIGQALDDALWATSVFMPIPEFRFFIIALSIQQETGGNLGEILSKLSSMIRKRQQLRLKIKAMSSEARASAMIIGSLPFVMMGILYVVNSEYIMTLFTDPRGTILLGVGASMLTIGVGLMVKLSKFEI